MAEMEHLELAAHRGEITDDVNRLVKKYRAIFDFDMPDIHKNMADKLILDEMSKAIEEIRSYLTY